MTKTEVIKERLIQTTIDLMLESNGVINEITTRKITDKAKVGVGLLNYHFKSKDKLIEVAVQRFISDKISEFRPNHNESMNTTEKLKSSISSVNEFLIEYESLSKISIINDHINPLSRDNSITTLYGLKNSLKEYNASDMEKNLLLYALISFTQNVFLRRNQTQELFGFDYNNKDERDEAFSIIIDKLFENNN